MKTLKECFINEAAAPKYYSNTIYAICDLLKMAPDCKYTLNSSDIEYSCEDILSALEKDNAIINEDSANGKCDPNVEIEKLKKFIGEEICKSIDKSCSLHYQYYSNED